MSKLATVRALNDSAPQLQILEQLRILNEDLKALPEAISSETASAIEPLLTLREQVQKIIVNYDQITKHQRSTLDALTAEMTAQASKSFQEQAQALAASIEAHTQQQRKTATAMLQVSESAKQISTVPHQLSKIVNQLAATAEATRPRWWKTATMLIVTATLAAALVPIGHYGFGRLLPPSGTVQSAQTLERLWQNATPREQELMREILRRPAR